MPELPEVETVTRALSKIVERSKVKSVEIYRTDLRWKVPDDLKEILENDIFEKPFRRGKYILIPTKKDNILLIHLGMSGQIKINESVPTLLKHDHIRIIIENKNNNLFSITYNDPRRFGYVDYLNKRDLKKHFLLKSLGVEPFSEDLTKVYLHNIFKKKTTNIKNALLDQKIIAGIGNIYASEALHYAGIRPNRISKKVSMKEIGSLVKSIKNVINEAIKKGGSTMSDFFDVNGKNGYFQNEHKVYGRESEPCFQCQLPIIQLKLGQRSSFFCKKCQK